MPAEPIRFEVAFSTDSTTTSTNNHGFENPFEHTPPQSPPTDFFADSEEEMTLYPYPRYNGEADAEAHIHAYLTTWQANHASKSLGVTGLSLDGQATSRYS